jgi:hypothetical protein
VNQANTTLAQVIRSYVAAGAAELRVCTVGRIERFDPVKQVADVKPLLKDSVEGEDGQEIVESLPVISNVPVHFPGGGGFAETWPVAVGDLCSLVFTDRSIDRWFSNGGEVDPVDLSRHLLSNATAHMGVRDSQSVLAEFDTARAVWGNKGPRMAADGTSLHLGVAHNESGTQDAVRGTAFLNALDQFLTMLDTNTTTAGTGLSTAGTSITSAAPLNAVPMYGGALASPALVAAGAALASAGAAVTAIKAGITSFKALWSTLSTNKVKTP